MLTKVTKTIWVDDRTLQIATMMIDSYGDTVYVWVEEADDHCRVSDGGRILFKLDPNEEDKELYETAEDIALGSGYEFDENHCEIFVDVDRKNVAQAAMKTGTITSSNFIFGLKKTSLSFILIRDVLYF